MGLAKLDPPYILTWRQRLTRRAVNVHLYIMLPEIPADEFAAALDACVDRSCGKRRNGRRWMLWPLPGGWEWSSLKISDLPRARFVQLADADGRGGGQATIVVGLAERPEREQWAVAHEIGESIAYRVFDTLGVRPEMAPPTARELVANHLASCLLLPRRWFAADGPAFDWDLFELKRRYSTASHELIARRMLEMRPPIVITVCDHGRIALAAEQRDGPPAANAAGGARGVARVTRNWFAVRRSARSRRYRS